MRWCFLKKKIIIIIIIIIIIMIIIIIIILILVGSDMRGFTLDLLYLVVILNVRSFIHFVLLFFQNWFKDS